jgi:thiol:disulfide interchange protein DsbD
MFPSLMNSLPKSGGWLNVVKVVLGMLELAFALKFLSNWDYALQYHFLERETFIALWIAIFGVLALDLFGKIRLPHDSKIETLKVGRTIFATIVLAFTVYMIPGLWGAPLKLISAFPPPSNYSESPLGFGGSGGGTYQVGEHVDGMHLGPQKIMVFHDYDKAYAHAKKENKPLFVDYTGYTCVNCRKMEETVWGENGILETLQNDVVIVSLHTDDPKKLPETEQTSIDIGNGRMMDVKTFGDKWKVKQILDHNILAQPYYVMQNPDGSFIKNGSATYKDHSNPAKFKAWLDKGMELSKK